MFSTATSSSMYINRWGFDRHDIHSNVNFTSKYLDLLHDQHLFLEHNSDGQHAEEEHCNAPHNFSWLSHLPGFGLTDLLATHVLGDGQRRVHTEVNGTSHGTNDTPSRKGSLSLSMPDIREKKASTLSATPGQVKARLVEIIADLEREIAPPTGHLCLVFTDIRNSTQLWDKNPAMGAALHVHNDLLLGHLLYCGGYVVKTEGDSFMCTFPTTPAAVWWCLTAQLLLLHASWPSDLLNCEEGREVYDEHGTLLARGLSVRMGIHCGTPVCEADPITGRMDYFGSMVNRTARICGSAAGGQIMCSADVVREIRASVFETGPHTDFQPAEALETVREMVLIPKGEIELKGLDVPEMAALAYPSALLGRQNLDASGSHLCASPASTTLDSPAGPDSNSRVAQSPDDHISSDDVFLER
ncbi:nucleotide cyclase [Suillus ampliporus]|nr:nucleotide cyclase [Suillus ampliporus]